ncbi:spore germination lipoprotein GerD [Gorillibacterium massiliense]|uniref:spore germination lipoprotein GerD n=1 Tax=Gorillibacterium massiliense TaxID=1280390 RepID=UPI0004B6C97A|nr:spore germination lipoprotein GerD [Gorillibacterium massiliense]
MSKIGWAAGSIAALLLTTSCGMSGGSSGSSGQSYKDTKTIVLDVLKSEEAQDTIKTAINKGMDKTTKLLSTGEGIQMQVAVKEILTGSDGSKLIEKTMKDPKFASDFAKALSKDNEKLQKQLIKDPEYQKSMLDLMKSGQYQAVVLNAMKGPEYRLMVMDLMKESLQSPLFRSQLMELMSKAVEEQTKPKAAGQVSGEQKGQESSDKSQDEEKGSGQESESGQDQGGGGGSSGQ